MEQGLKLPVQGFWVYLNQLGTRIEGGETRGLSLTQEFINEMVALTPFRVRGYLDTLQELGYLSYQSQYVGTYKGKTVKYSISLLKDEPQYLPRTYGVVFPSIYGLSGLAILHHMCKEGTVQNGQFHYTGTIRHLITEINGASRTIQLTLKELEALQILHKTVKGGTLPNDYVVDLSVQLGATNILRLPPLARDLLIREYYETELTDMRLDDLYERFYYPTLRNFYAVYKPKTEKTALLRTGEIFGFNRQDSPLPAHVASADLQEWQLGTARIIGQEKDLLYLMELEETNTYAPDKGIVRVHLNLLTRHMGNLPIFLTHSADTTAYSECLALPIDKLAQSLEALAANYGWHLTLKEYA